MTFTVTDTVPRSQYTAAGAQTAFAVPFEWRDDADIKVYVNSVLKTLGTDYTLTGAETTGGGTCTFLSAMAGGEKVVIYGDMAVERDVEEYTTGGQLPGLVLEASLDDLTMRMKQLRRDIDRTLHISVSDTSSEGAFLLPTVDSRKGKYGFFFNASTGLPELFSSIGATALSRSIIGEYLNPQTAAEVAEAVTPSAFYFAPGNIGRYANLSDAIKATKDDILFLGKGSHSVSGAITLTKRTIIEGAGCNSGCTVGSIISNIASNAKVFLVDDNGTNDAQRCSFRGFGILHHAASHAAIRDEDGAYGDFQDLVINCASLGKAGIEIGDDVDATAARAWQATLNNVRVDDAVSYCLRLNTTGHTFDLSNLSLRTSVANAIGLYVNAEMVFVRGGQIGASGTGGRPIVWDNRRSSGLLAGGGAKGLRAENVGVGKYYIDITGVTQKWHDLIFEQISANLTAGVTGTVIRFDRAVNCVLLMPPIETPTGGGTLAEWTANSEDCKIVVDLDGAKAPCVVSGSATRPVKEVYGRIALSAVTNITTYTNLTVILTDGIVELPGIVPIHNGVSWNYVPVTPAQIVANTDNYAPTGLGHNLTFRLSTDASRNLTGIVAQAGGTRMRLMNVGSFDLVLVHDATSTAANRFLCPGSANKTLNANDSVDIEYDSTSSRWRVVAD
jgi:hypothetical protein